ncbi:hypothetical protein Tco_0231096 [Tanacetum coccineum]
MPHPSRYFELPKTSTDEITREWMASQTKADEQMKNQVVKLECQINQGLRNRQTITENLERQFKYLEKTQHTQSLPRTTNTKPRYEFVYKPPSIRNENDKGDVKVIEEDVIKPIPTMPNPNLINSNSPTAPPFHEDYIVHIPYTNAKTFLDVALPNHVGDNELKLIYGVRNGVLTKKESKKDINADNEGGCLEEKSIDLRSLCWLLRSIYHMEFDRDFFGGKPKIF